MGLVLRDTAARVSEARRKEAADALAAEDDDLDAAHYADDGWRAVGRATVDDHMTGLEGHDVHGHHDLPDVLAVEVDEAAEDAMEAVEEAALIAALGRVSPVNVGDQQAAHASTLRHSTKRKPAAAEEQGGTLQKRKKKKGKGRAARASAPRRSCGRPRTGGANAPRCAG